MRRPRPRTVALLLGAVAAACTGPPSLLLAPTSGADAVAVVHVAGPAEDLRVGPAADALPANLSDAISVVISDAIPDVSADVSADDPAAGGGDRCGGDVAWDDAPRLTQVVEAPYGVTAVLEGERGGSPMLVVCDLTLDGDLVTSDSLASTGTTRPVGNDYAARVGAVLGRVDVGIPDGAVEARYDVGGWTLTVDVTGLQVLRLHAEQGGSPEDGFAMGTVTFLDADGRDVTPPSIELPDVIHGVPRDRGSAVETPADGG